jgi:hypothetical protein
MFNKVARWFGKELEIVDIEEERRLQATAAFPCRPSRRPGVYGRIYSVPPQWILECVPVASKEVFGVNHLVQDLSFGQMGGLEVLLVTQKRGPVRYLEIVTSGDYAHYKANPVALKTFRDHSCLNRDQWCFVSQVKPIDEGFLVVDRHRVLLYNYTWLAEGSTAASDIPDVYVNQFGMMNADELAADEDAKLKFPTAVAEYKPYNWSLVALYDEVTAGVSTSQFEITSLIPHAWCRLLFVADTGNHRVMILNATDSGQFDYIGQYGITGEARDNSTGFDWPWGIAVYSPAWEGRYEQAYANVFVVDRRNHRLVKLNLGYPLMECGYDIPYQEGPLYYDELEQKWICRRYDKPQLYWSAEYGRDPDVYNRRRGLTDPTAVGIYKHYILEAEVGGNAITMLRVDHHPPFGLKFVSYFKPVQGVAMQGGMAVSQWGYVWYNYLGLDMNNYFTAFFLPEILRESQAPNRLQDFLETCVNETWYAELMLKDPSIFVNHMAMILNASVINWVNPDRPGYIDVHAFNKSSDFNMELLNQMVFNYTMVMCEPPPTPTPPPFFGGNDEGWVIDGKSQSEFARRSWALRSSRIDVGLATCCIAVWLSLVLFRP